ncbi:hypothetical protein [Brevundimonas sp. LM2]|uniref:hypothetical protein n=1 Tax=Brevundimonas sp. LM2 TaxID=1938605 RepID=UPI0015C5778F|nr:hypothetical protein [Brevundimonas sp. LM2]
MSLNLVSHGFWLPIEIDKKRYVTEVLPREINVITNGYCAHGTGFKYSHGRRIFGAVFILVKAQYGSMFRKRGKYGPSVKRQKTSVSASYVIPATRRPVKCRSISFGKLSEQFSVSTTIPMHTNIGGRVHAARYRIGLEVRDVGGGQE